METMNQPQNPEHVVVVGPDGSPTPMVNGHAVAPINFGRRP